MDDKLKKHLQIERERYPLVISREEEIFYREAAKMIDNKLNKYRSLYPNLGTMKHWTMVALELAYENAKIKDSVDTSPYTEKIKQLEDLLDGYIKDSASK